ncbi:MAG: hypothetical protein S4CHLAM45_04580 [Chlamydiales bacterium]|nr:hypothetical protein [Chlamydiales bacterium]MCH9619310.1 hypothetical protein [Chlamydiales bacterium]MCH9622572.1 hypothetical protein [Chlamydiales bacterium]
MEKTEPTLKFIRKLLLLLNEQLPGKRIFYVYTHKNGYDRFHHGLKANTELSYHPFVALKKHFPRVTFLRFQGESSKRIAQIREKDVVIGHIGETFLKASRRTRKMVAFSPWNGHEDHSTSISPASLSFEVEKRYYDVAASLVFLTSEFNKRTYLEKAANFWHPYLKDKRVRVVHQPIDLSLFPRIKTTYTTSNFLYIGNTNHMKCVPDSRRLVESVGRTLHTFGTGEKNFNHLNKSQVTQIPHLADFFIQPGMWEAQCVSILESAARGFIPIVSPDTGYPYDHPYLLRYGDFDYNKQILNKLIKTTYEERAELADTLHQKLITDPNHNHWDQLTDILIEEVKQLYYN